MDFLQHLVDVIPLPGSQIAVIAAGVLEFALRLTPSQKPLSILHLVSQGLQLIGSAAAKAGDLLDKILPQNLK